MTLRLLDEATNRDHAPNDPNGQEYAESIRESSTRVWKIVEEHTQAGHDNLHEIAKEQPNASHRVEYLVKNELFEL